MKKYLLIFVFVLIAGITYSQELTLDQSIAQSARDIEKEFAQNTMVVVLNFTSPSNSFSDYVIEELIGELLNGRKVAVVDRRNISAIMGEMNFQYSGFVSDESMQSIGKMLGAQTIVSSSLTDMGANYRFRIRIISVETARIISQISLNLKKDSQVLYLMGGAKAMQEAERQQPKWLM